MSGKVGMKKYPLGVREAVINEYQCGKSQSEISREFGISRYSIQSWLGLRPEKDQLPKFRGRKPAKTLQEYKYENKRLKMQK